MGRNKKNSEKSKINFQAPKLNLSPETSRGAAVVVFSALAIVTFLSAMDLAGSFGNSFLGILKWAFGVLAYFVPVLLLLVAILLGKQKIYKSEDEEKEPDHGFYWRIYLGSFLFTGSLAGLIHIFYLTSGQTALALAGEGKAGGFLGAVFGGPIYTYLEFWAGSIVLSALLIIGILVAFNVALNKLWNFGKKDSKDFKINPMAAANFNTEKVTLKNKKIEDTEDEEMEVPRAPLPTKIIHPSANAKPFQLEAMVVEERKDWKLPNFDLLEESKTEVDSGNIEVNVAIIKKTLADFGIEAEMGEVNVGPTVTQYTLRPATGVKLSQIAALQDNLALELAAKSLRMELPIPGKPLVGIEVPNKTTAIVHLRSVIQTPEFVDHKSKLAFALGRDVAGHPIIADLAKMPHLLIAGATGMGKSVGINSLLISLLYRNTPQDVKFIVIDPKRVEMTPYNGIPHLLTPVVTDHEKAVNALKWAVAEMERRYKLLAEVGKRNIMEYNEGNELPMHYIVILVDELADLMSVAQADVEAAIVRLAQMARAVGIHLVVATQRPSVDIITGLIKANITSRIAFAVGSQIDSRTILDSGGAEKLLGNGDLLFITAELNKPRRIQGAYIGEKEVRKVVDFFKAQVGAVIYNEEILEKPKRAIGVPGFDGGGSDEDSMYEEAVEEVRRAGKASASLLQRRLRVGYARAARLLDILEDKGIIGPGDGAKPREVYGIVTDAEKAEYGVEGNNSDDENG